MPILTDGRIATRVHGVRAAQDVLRFMYDEPWSVELVKVLQDGRVIVCFFGGFNRHVGAIKDDYEFAYGDGSYGISSWEITGGRPLPEYVSGKGQRIEFFGLNLVLAKRESVNVQAVKTVSQ